MAQLLVVLSGQLIPDSDVTEALTRLDLEQAEATVSALEVGQRVADRYGCEFRGQCGGRDQRYAIVTVWDTGRHRYKALKVERSTEQVTDERLLPWR